MTPTAPLTTVPLHLHPSHLEVPLCPRHSCPSLRRPGSPATNEGDSRPPRLFLRVRQAPPQTPFYLPMQIKNFQTSTQFIRAPDTRPPRSLFPQMGGYLPNSPPPPCGEFSATSPLGGGARNGACRRVSLQHATHLGQEDDEGSVEYKWKLVPRGARRSPCGAI